MPLSFTELRLLGESGIAAASAYSNWGRQTVSVGVEIWKAVFVEVVLSLRGDY